MFHSCKATHPLSEQSSLSSIRHSSFGPAHIGFVLLTTLTWLMVVCAIVGGVYLVTRPDSWVDVVVGVLLIPSVLWSFYPRLDSPPPDELCANPATFPAVHEMVKQVATALNVPTPMIVLTEQYTAGFGRFGWRHHPVLFLGHGLLSVLNRQETVMLLAHELYHVSRSGWSHSRLIKITVNGIHNLIRILSLQPLLQTNDVPRSLKLPLAPLILLRYLFQLCIATEMREIETEADDIALTVCSAPAMVSLMQKIALRHVPPVQAAYEDATPASKYVAIRQAADRIERIPFSRLWQAILAEEPKPFDMHPTVKQRIERAERVGRSYVRPIVLMGTYNHAHKELSKWPVWLENIEQQFHEPGENTLNCAHLPNPVMASLES